MPDYELLGEAEYFPCLTKHISYQNKVLHKCKRNKGEQHYQCLAKQVGYGFFKIARSAVPKSLRVDLDKC